MKAKFVNESIEDILKPKEGALEELKKWTLKNLLLMGETLYPEMMHEWMCSNKNLADALEYKGIDDANNIVGFDFDIMAEEFPGDYDLFLDIIKNSQLRRTERIPSNRAGGLNLDIVYLNDGSKVIKYEGGLSDGFISRKEWLT